MKKKELDYSEIIENLSYSMTMKDFDTVFNLLNQYPSIINECYGPNEFKDFSLLLDAIFMENEDILHRLLELGANPNKSCSNGFSIPLLEATENGWLNGVKLLVQYNADINTKSKFKETALEIAQKEEHDDIVKFLQSLS